MFIALNSGLLAAVTNWQIRHRLRRTVLSGPGEVDRGERAWVAQPRIDSCHTVWMELHDDLLATLGLKRGS